MIRLNISWSALEPERGQYSDAYLSQIDDALRWGREAGVYIVLDMHQDGWWNGPSPENVACRPGTEPMWGYDGAPEWATITEGAPRCQFTGRDISPAGNRAFEHFYFNTNGVRDALAETWGMLAMRYQSNPMVAGFDLLNEPGFGETAPATTALKLGEFYDAAIREIRDAGGQTDRVYRTLNSLVGTGRGCWPATSIHLRPQHRVLPAPVRGVHHDGS